MSASGPNLFVPPRTTHGGVMTKAWKKLPEIYQPNRAKAATDTEPAVPAEKALPGAQFGYAREADLATYLKTRDPSTVVFIDCRSDTAHKETKNKYKEIQSIPLDDNKPSKWDIISLELKADADGEDRPRRDLDALKFAAQKSDNTVVFFCTAGKTRSPIAAAWYFENFVLAEKTDKDLVDRSKQVVIVVYEGVNKALSVIDTLKKQGWELQLPTPESVWA